MTLVERRSDFMAAAISMTRSPFWFHPSLSCRQPLKAFDRSESSGVAAGLNCSGQASVRRRTSLTLRNQGVLPQSSRNFPLQHSTMQNSIDFPD